MKIVVVIPIYLGVNHKDFEESLKSVVNQKTTYTFKIFVVKDGEINDNIQKILSKYDSNISVIGRDKNMGLASILNYSLKEIPWDYYFRMDSDDIISPDRIQVQLDYILSNPEYHAVGTQFIRFVEGGKEYNGRTMPNELNKIIKTAIFRSPTVHASMLYKKSFFELNGFYDESFRYGCEDYDLFSRAVLNKVSFTTIDKRLYLVRSAPELKFRRLRFKNLTDAFKISSRYIFYQKLYIYIFPIIIIFILKFILKFVPPNLFQKIKDNFIK
jgi:hypothetical protein